MNSSDNMLDKLIKFCLHHKLVVILLTLLLILGGIITAPFDWHLGDFPREPVPVDAIPDIGENQQIVFTPWPGRSPRDIEDQITYPLTVSLLGIPGVKTVRSYSYFGFSTVYVIFDEEVEFYWSRSRLLEKLNSLPTGSLPENVKPTLGPDATALGQVFWYTLEGFDEQGHPTGGWDLHELRSIQDYNVKYALQSAKGVAEVASIGGYVQEYQVDVDPNALVNYNLDLAKIYARLKNSNIDIGAGTTEINRVEYVVRGVGFIKNIADIENVVIAEKDNTPLRIKDIAHVTLGPAQRRGALDKGGAEAVGGVVVVRFGENPLATINHVKEKIAEISHGLPKKTLKDGRVSQVKIVPFYDRTGLINETLKTLNTALVDQILVTIIVIIILLMNIRTSLLISSMLPLTVLAVFIAMKLFHVDANIVALSGIAIAIGTVVDMGIIVTENIVKHLKAVTDKTVSIVQTVFEATKEVSGAVVTAIATTIISFLPVFTMEAAEGKLFKPLAYTKTFALAGSVIIALLVLPMLASIFLKQGRKESKEYHPYIIYAIALLLLILKFWMAGLLLALIGLCFQFRKIIPQNYLSLLQKYSSYLLALIVAGILSQHWLPLGVGAGTVLNFLFVGALFVLILIAFKLFLRYYESMLSWCLDNRKLFLILPVLVIIFGLNVWLGFDKLFGFMPEFVRSSRPFVALNHTFPGMGKEFMPDLDEGSFLYMPTTMPHASIGEVLEVMSYQDAAFNAIPEVESAVGKLGRVDSPLDPAPISMIETVINYKTEYKEDAGGNLLKFKYDSDNNQFVRDENGNLIEDSSGRPFRQWRDHIKSPDDIWDEIVKAGKITGTTSAPRLQPISARIVMLQSGMRAPMGIKISGPDLETIEKVGSDLELLLKKHPLIKPATVVSDKIVGKPYLEINIDRDALARHGLLIKDVQDIIAIAVGGKSATTTVEGRERYSVRLRYQRELRSDIDDLKRIMVKTPGNYQVPLGELATIEFVRGPMVIKSENTFLVGYVIFDKKDGYAQGEVVDQVDKFLKDQIALGGLVIPAGVSYSFEGSYKNQVRSENRLKLILPIVLVLIILIIYFQFKRLSITFLIFSSIFVAWSGGFIMLWLYGQGWFMDISLFGMNLREIFRIEPYNLSIAVWVGFLALFGIASDDGVLISTYLQQVFERDKPHSKEAIKKATIMAAQKRIRPALMTSATTILALLPILTSSGKGADIMIPMAIPSFGGMILVVLTVFLVPVLYASVEEFRLSKQNTSLRE